MQGAAMTGGDPALDTTAVRPGFEISIDRLDEYLRAQIPEYGGPPVLRQFRGGQSNPTYLIETPAKRYVLRRKPSGALLASAHAVDREYRIVSALHGRTGVPVARPYTLCTDASVIGAMFYVMEYVQGRICWDATLPCIVREQRAAHFSALAQSLAALHAVDIDAVGMGDFGRHGGYVARQLTRWSKQYREDPLAGRVDALDKLIPWLEARLPAKEPVSLVHGDFRFDNAIFDFSAPRLLAMIDWELATLGDPRCDFAYLLLMYRLPATAVAGFAGTDLAAAGIPSEADFVAAYQAVAPHVDLSQLDYFVVFNMFRLAAIFHGIRGRVARGTAANERAREYAKYVEQVAELAWEAAREPREFR